MSFSDWWVTVLRIELTKQLLRWRSLVAFAALGAVPVFAGVATASVGGRPEGRRGGLLGCRAVSAAEPYGGEPAVHRPAAAAHHRGAVRQCTGGGRQGLGNAAVPLRPSGEPVPAAGRQVVGAGGVLCSRYRLRRRRGFGHRT